MENLNELVEVGLEILREDLQNRGTCINQVQVYGDDFAGSMPIDIEERQIPSQVLGALYQLPKPPTTLLFLVGGRMHGIPGIIAIASVPGRCVGQWQEVRTDPLTFGPIKDYPVNGGWLTQIWDWILPLATQQIC